MTNPLQNQIDAFWAELNDCMDARQHSPLHCHCVTEALTSIIEAAIAVGEARGRIEQQTIIENLDHERLDAGDGEYEVMVPLDQIEEAGDELRKHLAEAEAALAKMEGGDD